MIRSIVSFFLYKVFDDDVFFLYSLYTVDCLCGFFFALSFSGRSLARAPLSRTGRRAAG